MSSCAHADNARLAVQSIRFPVEKLATTGDRVSSSAMGRLLNGTEFLGLVYQIMILLQAVLGGITGQEIKTETVNPMLEIGAIWPHAIRIAKGERSVTGIPTLSATHACCVGSAMFDLAVLREDGAARLALEL